MRTELKHSVLAFVLNRTGNERFGAVLCGNTCQNLCEIHVFTIIYCVDTRSFSPGHHLRYLGCQVQSIFTYLIYSWSSTCRAEVFHWVVGLNRCSGNLFFYRQNIGFLNQLVDVTLGNSTWITSISELITRGMVDVGYMPQFT